MGIDYSSLIMTVIIVIILLIFQKYKEITKRNKRAGITIT